MNIDSVNSSLYLPIASARSETVARDQTEPGPARTQKNELSDEEKAQVQELKRIDREVRAHEQAHAAAGGGHVTGGPTYEYTTGPDGRLYAVAGEVGISTSPVSGDPEATIQKMRQVRAAAMAPGDPSAQDRSVAAQAAATEAQAQQELARSKRSEQSDQSTEQISPGPLEAYRQAQEASVENPLFDLIA